jgi:hypothetical protein
MVIGQQTLKLPAPLYEVGTPALRQPVAFRAALHAPKEGSGSAHPKWRIPTRLQG